MDLSHQNEWKPLHFALKMCVCFFFFWEKLKICTRVKMQNRGTIVNGLTPVIQSVNQRALNSGAPIGPVHSIFDVTDEVSP